MVDFVSLANTAKTLVDENGRTITLRELETTSSDPAKPWKAATDPRNPLASSIVRVGAFVPLSSASKLGLTIDKEMMVKRAAQVMLVAPGAVETIDYSIFDEVLDGTDVWRITFMEVLKPADTTLLYFFGVDR